MGWTSENPIKTKLLFGLTLIGFGFVLIVFLEILVGYVSFKEKLFDNVNSRTRKIILRENTPNTNIKEKISKEAKTRNGIVNLPQTEYRLNTDDDGFILPNKIHQDPDMTIFFLGGSTTECRAVSEDLRFPFLAGRLLEKSSGLKVNSYNGGVSGNHSFHSINILLNKVLAYRPDIVVLKHNSNDVLLIPYGTYWDNAPGKTLVMDNTTSAIKKKSNFFSFMALRRRYYSVTTNKAAGPLPDNYNKYAKRKGDTIIVEKAIILELYENSLKTFINICKAWEIEPVLMTQAILKNPKNPTTNELPEKFNLVMPGNPLKDSTMLDVLYSFHKHFNNIIRKVAKEEAILLIDLKEKVTANDHKYLYDLYHYNDKGSMLVAGIIAEELQSLLEIK